MKPQRTELEEQMYAWVSDYLPEYQAEELTKLVSYQARKYGRAKMTLGILIGAVGVVILLKWAA